MDEHMFVVMYSQVSRRFGGRGRDVVEDPHLGLLVFFFDPRMPKTLDQIG